MSPPYAPPAGLCESCANVRIVDTRKGSRFFMCQLSEVDPRFPRYPRTPVLQCIGYTPVPAGDVVVVEQGDGG
ncbi:MAG TPA: hypothetical protein VE871_17800 [Longimicrobium sp.]|nr:hypothetical protein [Longimicrobium sp.]